MRGFIIGWSFIKCFVSRLEDFLGRCFGVSVEFGKRGRIEYGENVIVL